MSDTILNNLVDDLIYLTADGLTRDQDYTKHPDMDNAVIVETYTDDGEVEDRHTVTLSIEK